MPYTTNPDDGVRIYYEVEGDGPPLVLLHGFPGSLRFWRRAGYVDAFRESHRVILLDARGHGRSDKPHDPDAYDMQRRVQDITSVLDELAIVRSHFLGYSAGGRVAFGLAAYAPERITSYIIGGTHCYPYDPAVLDWIENTLRSGMDAFVEAQERAVGERSEEDRERLIVENDPDALIAATLAARAEPDWSSHLTSMTQPGLLFAGEHDDLNDFHDRLRDVAGIMPNADFFSIPEYGHDASQHPDLILPRVQAFLQQVDA